MRKGMPVKNHPRKRGFMMRIAVFASGTGSNFAAIASAVKSKKLNCEIALLVCDNPLAKVIEKARRAGVRVFIIERASFKNKQDFENIIIGRLKDAKIDLIVLAGYMRILSSVFVSTFKNRIINIHPSLLPSFKGAHGISEAFSYGAKITGVTVHFVDEYTDHGPIILQEAVRIKETDSLGSLEKRIHALEHKIYPHAIKLFISGKLKIKNRKVAVS